MACVFYLLDSFPFLYIKRGPIFHFIEEGHWNFYYLLSATKSVIVSGNDSLSPMC